MPEEILKGTISVTGGTEANKQLDDVRKGAQQAKESIEDLGESTGKMGGNMAKTTAKVIQMQEAFQKAQIGGRQTMFIFNDLFDALAVGGPWGIALTAAAAGLGFLWREMNNSKASAKALAEELRDRTTAALNDLAKELEDVERRLEDFGKSQDQARVDRMSHNLDMLRASTKAMEDQIKFINNNREFARAMRFEKAGALPEAMNTEAFREQKSLIEHLNSQIDSQKQIIAQKEVIFEKEVDYVMKAKIAADLEKEKKEASRASARASKEEASDERFRFKFNLDMQKILMREKRKRWREEEQARKEQDRLAKEQLNNELKYINEKRALEKRLEAERARVRQEQEAALQKEIGFAVGIASQAADILVTNEKDAIQKIGAMTMAKVGDRLAAEGTVAGAKGAVMLIESAGTDPRGWGLVAQGSTMVATGIAMGAGGAWLGRSGGGSGGGGRDGVRMSGSRIADDQRRRTSGGVGGGSVSSTSGQSGSGPIVLNINMGGAIVGRPEDAARTLANVMNRMIRNGEISNVRGAF